MNEVWARVALVAAALAVAGVSALIWRRRARAGVRLLNAKDLAAGFYFFSASTCSTCARARDKLDSSLGVDGYKEFSWERHPEVFTKYDIDQVPAVMVVDDSGRGRLYPGQPDRALNP